MGEAPMPRPASSSSSSEPSSVEPLKFVYDLPPISERQLAIVKLVARYVASDASFAQTRAPEFEFTHAGHSLHALFETFVAQYKLVLGGAQPKSPNVLERAVHRALHEPAPVTPEAATSSSEASAARDAPAPAPRSAEFAAVDWQDFVVLETVEFFSADLKGTSRLSAPLTREEAALHKEQTSRKRRPREPLYKSPYTGEAVPASQFDEHMRVHSLDAASQQQRETAAQRQATTNLDTKGAAENLARWQEKRRRLLEE